MNIKAFVFDGNFAEFDSFRAGVFYYNIPEAVTLHRYQFQIPIEDTGGATFNKRERAVTLMRWIRKSIENKTMIKVNQL